MERQGRAAQGRTERRRLPFWPLGLGGLAAGIAGALAFWVLAGRIAPIMLVAAWAGSAIGLVAGLLLDAALPFEVSAKIDRVTYFAFGLASLLGAVACVWAGFATGKLTNFVGAVPLIALALFCLRKRERQKTFALACAAIGAWLLISVLSGAHWFGLFLAAIAFIAAITSWRSDPEAWPWLT